MAEIKATMAEFKEKETVSAEEHDMMRRIQKAMEDQPPRPLKENLMWFGIAVAVGLLIWLLPTPDGLSERGHKFLALLVTILILWVSEALPIGVTALGVGMGLVLFEIQTSAAAWAPYAHRTVIFVFTIIMLGVILGQTSIPVRIMNGVIKIGTRNVMRLSFTLCMSATFLSAWAHDATITIILLYAMLPLFLKMGLTPDKTNAFTKHFMFIIPLGAASGGGGTFIGSGRAPASAELFGEMTGYHIGFMEYMSYQWVPSMIYGLATWAACWLMFPPRVKELPAEVAVSKLPPATTKEKTLIWFMLVTLGLWLITDLTEIHVAVWGVAFIMMVILFDLVSWRRCLAEFPWNPMLVFGAGFALGVAMLDTGAGRWIAEQMFPIFAGAPWPIVSFGVGWISAIITSFMANAAATTLLIPVVVPMADLAGIPTVPIAMTVPLATTFVLLVIGCPPTLIAYGMGYFTQVEAFKVFFVRALFCLALAGLVQAIWWPLVGMPGDLEMMTVPAKLGFWGTTPLPLTP